MRLIDADRLLEDKRIGKYYHLKNGDIAIPLIDIKHAPTIEERKKGKWIDEVINGGLPVQVCDQCNTFFFISLHGWRRSFLPELRCRYER